MFSKISKKFLLMGLCVFLLLFIWFYVDESCIFSNWVNNYCCRLMFLIGVVEYKDYLSGWTRK